MLNSFANAIWVLTMKWNDRIGRRLKLHDLHVLMTVAEMGSMGRAAERLAVSPPSVSKAIADMEHAVGVRLLDRTSKGVETTAYGRALLRRSMGAFDELRQGIKDIESLADPTVGEVRVGCPEAIADGLLFTIIDRFSQQYPRVAVSVTAVHNIPQEFRPLRDRSVDFLLAGFPKPFVEDDLELELLYEDRPFIVSGQNSRWAHRRKVELAELVDEPWLLPREGIFVSLLAEAFQTNNLPAPKLGVRTYSVHQRMMLLATDRFVSAEVGSVLRFNADRFPLKVLPVNFANRTWRVGIVTLKNRTVSPVVQTFLDCVREVAKPMAKANARRRT
jgi:DNA-binding transcriptional LysR family regulator